jgi:hypothetical protein
LTQHRHEFSSHHILEVPDGVCSLPEFAPSTVLVCSLQHLDALAYAPHERLHCSTRLECCAELNCRSANMPVGINVKFGRQSLDAREQQLDFSQFRLHDIVVCFSCSWMSLTRQFNGSVIP